MSVLFVDRQYLGESLTSLLMAYTFRQNRKHRVASGDSAKNLRSIAHVDIIGHTARISVAGLYHCDIAGKRK